MNLTEIEKAAVLLIALGPQRAQRILDRLSATDLLPIIAAIKRMGQISPEVRRAVLEEVNQILTDQAARRVSGARQPPPPSEPADPPPDLFDRLGPHLPDRIDPGRIDWDAAGFDFGSTPENPRPGRPPEEDP